MAVAETLLLLSFDAFILEAPQASLTLPAGII